VSLENGQETVKNIIFNWLLYQILNKEIYYFCGKEKRADAIGKSFTTCKILQLNVS